MNKNYFYSQKRSYKAFLWAFCWSGDIVNRRL